MFSHPQRTFFVTRLSWGGALHPRELPIPSRGTDTDDPLPEWRNAPMTLLSPTR